MTTQRTSKVEYQAKIIDILSDPEVPVPDRTTLAEQLGINRRTMYSHFSGVEIDDLYRSALLIRRERLAGFSCHVDDALFDACRAGDVKAIELYYKRMEGWAPKTKIEADLTTMTLAERLAQIEKEDNGESGQGTSAV